MPTAIPQLDLAIRFNFHSQWSLQKDRNEALLLFSKSLQIAGSRVALGFWAVSTFIRFTQFSIRQSCTQLINLPSPPADTPET
jgi:hypothetical protein